jgi:hypothetical protein
MAGEEEERPVARFQIGLERAEGAAHRTLIDIERPPDDEPETIEALADGRGIGRRGAQFRHVVIAVVADHQSEITRTRGAGDNQAATQKRQRGPSSQGRISSMVRRSRVWHNRDRPVNTCLADSGLAGPPGKIGPTGMFYVVIFID